MDRGDELLCLDQDVTLRCKHFPALYTKWVYDTRANWKVNGDVLSPDRSKYFSRQPSISMTHLVISLKPILFEAEQTLNYSCFLRVMNNVTLESDEVTISPLSKFKLYSVCIDTLQYIYMAFTVICGLLHAHSLCTYMKI